MVIVGNKSDLEEKRVVSTKAGLSLAKKMKSSGFVEASAKDSVNVTHVFLELALRIAMEAEMRGEIKKEVSGVERWCCNVFSKIEEIFSM